MDLNELNKNTCPICKSERNSAFCGLCGADCQEGKVAAAEVEPSFEGQKPLSANKVTNVATVFFVGIATMLVAMVLELIFGDNKESTFSFYRFIGGAMSFLGLSMVVVGKELAVSGGMIYLGHLWMKGGVFLLAPATALSGLLL